MRKAPFLLRKCDLPGCERQGAFVLDDGRAICDKHGLMLMLGDSRVTAENEKREKAHHDSLPDFEMGDD